MATNFKNDLSKPFSYVKYNTEKPFPTRTLKLGFVDLSGDSRPITNKRYSIVSAAHNHLAEIPVPASVYKKLDLDVYKFYVDDLPDFNKKNEGLLKISVDTKNPQNLSDLPALATLATNFEAKDGTYSPSFLYRGIFRNVIFEEWVNLQFDLYELDTDSEEYFNKVKQVVNDVPELKNLDIIKGIPYLNLATSLFESVIKNFGTNPDDYLWGEIPILAINPTLGGAFLRDGIYILYEERNSKDESLSVSNMEYVNEKLVLKNGSDKKSLSNHLIFGARLRESRESGNAII